MSSETGFFYKILKGLSPKYLTLYLQLQNSSICQTKYCKTVKQFNLPNQKLSKNIVKQTASRTDNFNNSFFSHCSQEWSNFSDDTKSWPSQISFKKALLSFVKTFKVSVFAIHDNSGIRLLTRLRQNFSHLNEYKFRHNFLDAINPMCSCGQKLQPTQNHVISRSKLLKNVYNLDQTLRNYDDDHLNRYPFLWFRKIQL